MDYRNAFDIKGSVAVITGGASGIGFDLAVAPWVMRGENRSGGFEIGARAGRGRQTSSRDRS